MTPTSGAAYWSSMAWMAGGTTVLPLPDGGTRLITIPLFLTLMPRSSAILSMWPIAVTPRTVGSLTSSIQSTSRVVRRLRCSMPASLSITT